MTPDPSLVVDEPPVAESMDPVPAWNDPEHHDNGSFTMLLGFVGLFLALGVLRSWWIPGIIVGLLFMLFMHELGHYLTARASGMKVTEFFLGFGPKIWSFNRGETEYGIKAIPAGAYVRIIGMTNLDEIDPAEEQRTYRSQPFWQRMVVICAGSTMHFLMAIVALVVLFGSYGYTGFNGPPWEVDRVIEGSTADDIGLEPGDRILQFEGNTFDTWDEFGEIVGETAVGPIEVEIQRDDAQVLLTGELGARSGDVVGNGFGIRVNEDRASQGWTVAAVRGDSSAEAFGFEVDDVILRAGDTPRPSQLDLSDVLQAAEGGPLTVVVLRRQNEVPLQGTVELDRTIPFRGFLGIGYRFVEVPEPSWSESVELAIEDFGRVAATNIEGLVDVLNPLNVVDAVFGEDEPSPSASPPPLAPVPQPDDPTNRPVSIIGIARLFAESESADEVLYLFMVVNIFIGLFNLVPLLPLDGGHAAMATYEKGSQLVTRNPNYRVDAAKLIPLTWLVIALLVAVGLWAALLDIFAWPV